MSVLILGNSETTFTSEHATTAGTPRAFQFTAQKSASVEEIQFRTNGNANTGVTSVKLGIFKEGSAAPGVFLGEGTFTGTPTINEWIKISGLSISIISGNVYWLAVLSIGGALHYSNHGAGGSTIWEGGPGSQSKLETSTSGWSASSAEGPLGFYALGTPNEAPYFIDIPPTFKSPRTLFKPFLVESEEVKNLVSIKSGLSFKLETSGKLSVGYKLPRANIESNLTVISPLKISQKVSSTLESDFSIKAPLSVKVPVKLSSTVESKLSVSAKTKTVQKLSSIVEPKFSIYADLSDKIKLKADIESIFSLEGNLAVAHPQEVPFLPPRTFPEEPFIPVYYA
jgi:hypothetical protein